MLRLSYNGCGHSCAESNEQGRERHRMLYAKSTESNHKRGYKWTLFNIDRTKQFCEFSAYVAFNKAKNGQTDIKHEKEKTFSWMSLLKIAVEKLPPAKIKFGNDVTACYEHVSENMEWMHTVQMDVDIQIFEKNIVHRILCVCVCVCENNAAIGGH